MPEDRTRHLQSRVEQGILVLTLTEPQLHGDTLANALRQELLAAVSQAGTPKVILDFGAVTSLSSEVFRPLITLRHRLEEAGGRLVFCKLSPTVAKAFAATRLISSRRTTTATFEVQPDVAAAVASLTQGSPPR
jgi:anti-anti-sigma factor